MVGNTEDVANVSHCGLSGGVLEGTRHLCDKSLKAPTIACVPCLSAKATCRACLSPDTCPL